MSNMMGAMGYADRLRQLCALRGLDQTSLASLVGVSKSSLSRILNGSQEPKLRLAYELARALGVTLDYLFDESQEATHSGRLTTLNEDEAAIMRIVRRLGTSRSMDRLLGVAHPPPPKPPRDRSGGADPAPPARRPPRR